MFNTPPSFGDTFRLEGIAIPSVCDLLLSYLSSLPAPILPPHILQQILTSCIWPSFEGLSKLKSGAKPPPAEPRCIVAAQDLLRQLPQASFDLLTYLLSYLAEVPHHPGNGRDHRYIAAIFGPSICISMETAPDLGLDETEVIAMARETLLWLLVFWEEISKDLYSTLVEPPSPDMESAENEFEPLEELDPNVSFTQWPPMQRLAGSKATPYTERPDPFLSASEAQEEHSDVPRAGIPASLMPNGPLARYYSVESEYSQNSEDDNDADTPPALPPLNPIVAAHKFSAATQGKLEDLVTSQGAMIAELHSQMQRMREQLDGFQLAGAQLKINSSSPLILRRGLK